MFQPSENDYISLPRRYLSLFITNVNISGAWRRPGCHKGHIETAGRRVIVSISSSLHGGMPVMVLSNHRENFERGKDFLEDQLLRALKVA